MNRARLRCATPWHIFPSPLTWRNGWLERCQSSGLHTACLQQPVCNKPCSALSSIATFLISNKAKTIRALGQSYHHDVILQLAAAYGQLQVSHSSQLVLQRGAAVVNHIFHREVVCRGPALIVLVPGDGIRMDAEYTYTRQVGAQHLGKINTRSLLVLRWELTCRHSWPDTLLWTTAAWWEVRRGVI